MKKPESQERQEMPKTETPKPFTTLGYALEKKEPGSVVLVRITRESIIRVALGQAPRLKFSIRTSIAFFDHMIETLAWRACLNIDASYENTQFRLTHVIAEDLGIVLGKAFRFLIEENMEQGINASGSAIAGIDEALAIAAVSFEGRCNTFIDLTSSPGAQKERCEDMPSADLAEFFRGFSQGAGATVSLKLLSGDDPHHSWEAAFRAFGEALRTCLGKNTWRAGTTPGVKGTLD